MNARSFLLSSISIVCLATASSGLAQVYRDTHAPSMRDFIPDGQPTQFEGITAVTFDKDGSKFVSGQTSTLSTAFSYLAKFDKQGNLLWLVPAMAADLLRTDNFGHVFALTKTANLDTPAIDLLKYDGSNGDLLNSYLGDGGSWGRAYEASDMVILPDGSPVVCGKTYVWPEFQDAQPKLDHPVVVKFLPDCEEYPLGAGVYTPMTGQASGIVNRVVADADGGIYFSGWNTDGRPSISQERRAFIGYCSPDDSVRTFTYFDYAGTDESFDDLALDPVTRVAVASGSSNAVPILGTYWIQSSSPFLAQTQFTSLGGYPAGSGGGLITVTDTGKFAVFVDTPENGPTRSYLVGYTPHPVTPWLLDQTWSQPIPSASASDGHILWDLEANKGGFALSLLSDSVPEVLPAGQRAFQLFTFSADGGKIDRQVFDHPSVNRFPMGPHRSPTMGGKLDLFGIHSVEDEDHFPVQSDSVEIQVQRLDGPDDRYEIAKGSNLDVDVPHGVIVNDGNQFVLLPLTASFVSKLPGVAVLNLNPDGSFHASFQAGFTGLTGFDYDVVQDGSVIATNHVKIVVKKPDPQAPVAADDEYTVAKGSAAITLNVLANDSDPEGKALKIVSVTADSNATTLKVKTGGKLIQFKPKKGFTGDISCDYTITDPQGLSATAHVTVHVS